MLPQTEAATDGYPKAIRSQADDLGDEFSQASGIDTGDELLTRQEFKEEADINFILNRYGVNAAVRTDGQYREIDYNLDLQQALAAIQSARVATTHVPEELRDKYPNWVAVLNGAETGQYQKDLQTLADKQAEREKAAKTAADYESEKNAIKRRQKVEKDLRREREDATGTEETPKT